MYALVVESPAKSKTIGKYLGKDFKILSSFGHVRALPTKKGSVDPDNNFMMLYDLTEQGLRVVPELIKQMKGVEVLYLATDPDREGEAISWHLCKVLQEKKVLPPKVYRVVFNEITKTAVQNALKNPRDIDINLVEAQRLRQALDYLVGFNLSPILWRKLPGSKSAGRVQSVALRILCEREKEIDIFKPQEYWNITVILKTDSDKTIETDLINAYGKKLEKTDIKNEEQAKGIEKDISGQKFKIYEIKEKSIKRAPPLPFITSTLQQSASTNLGFNSKKTMSIAQKLYEGIEIAGQVQGLITYMRTDGIYLAEDAIKGIRSYILEKVGDKYLPSKPVVFKKKVKNAQEAHESIRPTDINLTPENIKQYLTEDQFKLYNMIWRRTVASQMTDAVINSKSISFISQDARFIVYASCSSIEFDGFYKIYSDIAEKSVNPEVAVFIKSVKENDEFKIDKLDPKQNFTEPPRRYSEAGLIKKMEELGIGRPSTYATIISVLQDRFYATIHNKAFVPESRGRVVSAFLVEFFSKYVEYTFTADLEDKLDKVADGELCWLDVIENFWVNFNANVKKVDEISISDILKVLNQTVIDQDIIKTNFKIDDKCPRCENGKLALNVGKFGVFLACSNYPNCKFIVNGPEGDMDEFPKQINEEITLNKGPYGVYLKYEGKNFSIPKGVDISLINEEFAKKIVSLPKILGNHTGDKKEIKLGVGPYGFYLLHDKKYYNLVPGDIDSITLDNAIGIIDNYGANDPTLLKILGEKDDEPIQIKKGRYGPYIKCGRLNIAIPKGMDVDSITIDDAAELIEKKKSTDTVKKKVLPRKKS